MGLYVYAVAAAGVPIPAGLTGVGRPPSEPYAVAVGDVAAVVSEAPERLRARRRDLQAHQSVLLTLAAHGPVLPTRFGVVLPDTRTVRARMEAGQGAYLAGLDRVAGKVEMNLKASPAEGALPEVARQDPHVRLLRLQARRRPGYQASLRLGEAIATALGRRAAQAAAEVAASLAALADDTSSGPEVAGCVLNTSFLVPSGALDRFRGEAAALVARHSASAVFQLTGPLPCYSFAAAPAAVGA